MKILKKKKKKKNFFFFFFFFFFFLRLGIFFFKLEKKSPKSHWERGQISAPEDTKKSLMGYTISSPGIFMKRLKTKSSPSLFPGYWFSLC